MFVRLIIFLSVLIFIPMPVYAFNSGYLEFSITTQDSARIIDIACWYPTAQPEVEFKYNTVNRVGSVAVNADIATINAQYSVIIHSHGYSGGALVATNLCEQFARRGFIVFSPDHSDDFLLHPIKGEGMGMKLFADFFKKSSELYKKRENFNSENHVHRISDIRRLIDYIVDREDTGKQTLSTVLAHTDPSRIGLVGHSLGAYSSLSVVGANGQTVDTRVKAVLAWSPAIWMWDEDDYKNVSVPVMIQYGKLEPGPRLGNSSGKLDRAFSLINSPKYLAEIARAGHFAWIDGLPDSLFVKSDAYSEMNDAIFSLSIDFLDAYLQDNQAAKYHLADVSEERVGVSRYITGNLW